VGRGKAERQSAHWSDDVSAIDDVPASGGDTFAVVVLDDGPPVDITSLIP
jgi:hypothetical protein